MTIITVKKADHTVDVNKNIHKLKDYLTQENHPYEYHPRMINAWWEKLGNPSQNKREVIIKEIVTFLKRDPRFAYKDLEIWADVGSRHPFFGDKHIIYDESSQTISEESNTWRGRRSKRLNEAVYGKLDRKHLFTDSYPSNSVSYYTHSINISLPFAAIEDTNKDTIWVVFF